MKGQQAGGNEDADDAASTVGLFKNPTTGEQVRIMKRPKRRHRTDPPAKHHFERYYRYRKSPHHPWGTPVPIPDNPAEEVSVGGAAYLSEHAARILSELEEAGAEHLTATVNTITSRNGEQQGIVNSTDALKELVGKGLAVLRHEGSQDLSAASSVELLSQLASDVSVDPEDRLLKSDDSLPLVEIVATDRGRELAFEILDERGYQWWDYQDDGPSA